MYISYLWKNLYKLTVHHCKSIKNMADKYMILINQLKSIIIDKQMDQLKRI